MTKQTPAPKTEVDPTTKRLRSAKKLIHRAALEMSDDPRLAKAERKAEALIGEIHVILDEIEASKQQGGQP